ncbi:U-box domain-containing protein 34-like [Magnolia sinica]|uniref:U-box domain-containing protein 34-like n=1 Tax=Magnolia sinica TaxID=86752 RepID=UPI002659B37E|nr:U-box domain-containing protein 34-like [Magnolia sinica]
MSGGGMGDRDDATVAVAVGHSNGTRSRRAVRWAVENLMPHARRFLLVHVAPFTTSIPTPAGNHIPIKQIRGDVVDMYMQDMKLKFEEKFLPFKRLCRTREMETLVLNDDNPAAALVRHLSESGITSIVLGSSSLNWILRKLKGPDIPSTVLKLAPNNCNIYVVSRYKLKMKLADLPVSRHKITKKLVNLHIVSGLSATSSMRSSNQPHNTFTQREVDKQICSSTMESKGNDSVDASKPDVGIRFSRSFNTMDSRTSADGISRVPSLLSSSGEEYQKGNHHNFENMTLEEIEAIEEHDAVATFQDTALVLQCTEQADAETEMERLRLELRNTLSMYNKACEDLVYARNKVQLLFTECSDDARKVKVALEKEEISNKIIAEEKAKHLEVSKEIEVARQLLAKEAHERQRAEMSALKESSERKRIVDTLLSADRRYRRYTKAEIEAATDCFSEARKIGEGGYGKVYRCNIDHTPVAVKVLLQDAYDKKEEFLKEVEILSQLQHPHVVLLLGACPENGSLIYEYMGNGSLEDRIFRHDDTPPLPWFIRFRIIFEVACGLAFLHGSVPEPIVHRDLKPGNILLDYNYVSKIGDVGMAKLISDVVPDNVTEYRETVIAGTFYYMDPEYQRTGTVRPKSDLYAFGVIVLQLLTGKHPRGLITSIENAIKVGYFADVLDKSITDWPLADSEKLARIALKCCRLRCRDRPELESEIMPQLEELMNMTDAHFRLWRCNINAPSHYFCPILQEVMVDPYIAGDGFTYEYRAIKAWLERHNISPITKLRLLHNRLTPNHSLRSAILEWKSQATFSSS